MILGDICTRSCGFCAVTSGRPEGLDLLEPLRLAQTVETAGPRLRRHHLGEPRRPARRRRLRLRSLHPRHPPSRAPLPGRGAHAGLRGQLGRPAHRRRGRAGRLQPQHRDGAAALPPRAARRPSTSAPSSCCARSSSIDPTMTTKSGIMVGLGETLDEVAQTMADLARPRLRPADGRPVPAAGR